MYRQYFINKEYVMVEITEKYFKNLLLLFLIVFKIYYKNTGNIL